jgi:endogenous inhibitor of DNA gyrase (YacG/DUF329 family)
MKRQCPICGKKIEKIAKDKKQTTQITDFFPFCSQRCKLIDLNAWFESEYIVSSPLDERKKGEPDEPENMLK